MFRPTHAHALAGLKRLGMEDSVVQRRHPGLQAGRVVVHVGRMSSTLSSVICHQVHLHGVALVFDGTHRHRQATVTHRPEQQPITAHRHLASRRADDVVRADETRDEFCAWALKDITRRTRLFDA
jgi:hypothetical protein